MKTVVILHITTAICRKLCKSTLRMKYICIVLQNRIVIFHLQDKFFKSSEDVTRTNWKIKEGTLKIIPLNLRKF